MRLYTADGYADMRNILDLESPFNVVIGGRGTGKTYGALSEMLGVTKNLFLCAALRHSAT